MRNFFATEAGRASPRTPRQADVSRRDSCSPGPQEITQFLPPDLVIQHVNTDLGCPSFVEEPPGDGFKRNPQTLEDIKKYNSISLDADGKITFFEEKPKNPTSTLTGIALYYYPRSTISFIKQYVAEGNNPDQPGRLVQWLYKQVPVYTWTVPGIWYDIGSKETLEEANRIFSRR